jgi:nitrogen fixation/metabolism regulation signal transduction histidine kinase
MKEMVNAFSEYARAPDMEMSQFDLNRVIHEVADLYRARENGARLEVKLDENIPAIEADQGRIRQILHNLFRNSLEAMEGQADAEIDVETQLDHRDNFQVVVITVRDTGPGFNTDTVEQVFDPYVTSKPKGTGLGLSIVKKLVEEHGGHIQASNHAGGGAEIRIELPLDDTARDAMLPRISRKTEKRRERA